MHNDRGGNRVPRKQDILDSNTTHGGSIMKKNDIPQKVIDVLTECGINSRDALWDCHGTWVVLHKALEVVATKMGVAFEEPLILHADSIAKAVAIKVTGRLKERSEWSIGEAAPYNNKNAYPYAMAEKRAKDRVILKLVGLHGYVYSEDEADDFKASRTEDKKLTPRQMTADEEQREIDIMKQVVKQKAALLAPEKRANFTAWFKALGGTERENLEQAKKVLGA